MSYEKKSKFAYIVALFTVIFATCVGIMTATFSNHVLPLILGTGALCYGPVCFILCLIEIKRIGFRP